MSQEHINPQSHQPLKPKKGHKDIVKELLPRTEIRQDGLYVTVCRNDKDSFDLKMLEKAIEDAQVMNADLKRLRDVITRARGIPERIGKPFEYYNSAKDQYILVQDSPMAAEATISRLSLVEHIDITEQDVLYRLRRLGIVYGVDANAIKSMIENRIFDIPQVIAKGKMPENGLDAKIEEVAEIDTDAKPVERLDGTVDYKNIEVFKQIGEGEVIAIRYPPTRGTDGIDVHNNPVHAEPGEDVPLPMGKNTQLSDNNTKLIAACGGYLYRNPKDNSICVGEILVLPEDVDFSTGNIKYRGCVVVKGNVKSGFKVEAEGDVIVNGIVECAEIVSRRGRVEVKNGVFGCGRASLYAKKEIQVLFAQECQLEAEEKITAEKYLLHCKASAAEIIAANTESSIVGGGSVACKQIVARQVGSPKNIDTLLRIISPEIESADKRVKEVNALQEKIQHSLVPVQKRLKMMNSVIRKADVITERTRAELKKVLDEYVALTKKLEFIKMRKEELVKKKSRVSPMPGNIIVSGVVYPNVVIELYGVKKQIITQESQKRYFIHAMEVQTISIHHRPKE